MSTTYYYADVGEVYQLSNANMNSGMISTAQLYADVADIGTIGSFFISAGDMYVSSLYVISLGILNPPTYTDLTLASLTVTVGAMIETLSSVQASVTSLFADTAIIDSIAVTTELSTPLIFGTIGSISTFYGETANITSITTTRMNAVSGIFSNGLSAVVGYIDNLSVPTATIVTLNNTTITTSSRISTAQMFAVSVSVTGQISAANGYFNNLSVSTGQFNVALLSQATSRDLRITDVSNLVRTQIYIESVTTMRQMNQLANSSMTGFRFLNQGSTTLLDIVSSGQIIMPNQLSSGSVYAISVAALSGTFTGIQATTGSVGALIGATATISVIASIAQILVGTATGTALIGTVKGTVQLADNNNAGAIFMGTALGNGVFLYKDQEAASNRFSIRRGTYGSGGTEAIGINTSAQVEIPQQLSAANLFATELAVNHGDIGQRVVISASNGSGDRILIGQTSTTLFMNSMMAIIQGETSITYSGDQDINDVERKFVLCNSFSSTRTGLMTSMNFQLLSPVNEPVRCLGDLSFLRENGQKGAYVFRSRYGSPGYTMKDLAYFGCSKTFLYVPDGGVTIGSSLTAATGYGMDVYGSILVRGGISAATISSANIYVPNVSVSTQLSVPTLYAQNISVTGNLRVNGTTYLGQILYTTDSANSILMHQFAYSATSDKQYYTDFDCRQISTVIFRLANHSTVSYTHIIVSNQVGHVQINNQLSTPAIYVPTISVSTRLSAASLFTEIGSIGSVTVGSVAVLNRLSVPTIYIQNASVTTQLSTPSIFSTNISVATQLSATNIYSQSITLTASSNQLNFLNAGTNTTIAMSSALLGNATIYIRPGRFATDYYRIPVAFSGNFTNTNTCMGINSFFAQTLSNYNYLYVYFYYTSFPGFQVTTYDITASFHKNSGMYQRITKISGTIGSNGAGFTNAIEVITGADDGLFGGGASSQAGVSDNSGTNALFVKYLINLPAVTGAGAVQVTATGYNLIQVDAYFSAV